MSSALVLALASCAWTFFSSVSLAAVAAFAVATSVVNTLIFASKSELAALSVAFSASRVAILALAAARRAVASKWVSAFLEKSSILAIKSGNCILAVASGQRGVDWIDGFAKMTQRAPVEAGRPPLTQR